MWYKKPLSAYHFTVSKRGSDNDNDSSRSSEEPKSQL